MSEITITIAGAAGSGKSTLATLFEEWLIYNNFQVANNDNRDMWHDKSEEFFQQKLSELSKKVKIKIQSVTTQVAMRNTIAATGGVGYGGIAWTTGATGGGWTGGAGVGSNSRGAGGAVTITAGRGGSASGGSATILGGAGGAAGMGISMGSTNAGGNIAINDFRQFPSSSSEIYANDISISAAEPDIED